MATTFRDAVDAWDAVVVRLDQADPSAVDQ
jgi:hypothetical protein